MGMHDARDLFDHELLTACINKLSFRSSLEHLIVTTLLETMIRIDSENLRGLSFNQHPADWFTLRDGLAFYLCRRRQRCAQSGLKTAAFEGEQGVLLGEEQSTR